MPKSRKTNSILCRRLSQIPFHGHRVLVAALPFTIQHSRRSVCPSTCPLMTTNPNQTGGPFVGGSVVEYHHRQTHSPRNVFLPYIHPRRLLTLRHFAYTHVPPVLMYSIVSRLLSFSSEEVARRRKEKRRRERQTVVGERVNRKYMEGNLGISC